MPIVGVDVFLLPYLVVGSLIMVGVIAAAVFTAGPRLADAGDVALERFDDALGDGADALEPAPEPEPAPAARVVGPSTGSFALAGYFCG